MLIATSRFSKVAIEYATYLNTVPDKTYLYLEIQINKENTGLPQVLEILLDKDEEYTDEERGKITESLKTVANTTP